MTLFISARCKKCWTWVHVPGSVLLSQHSCSCKANDWDAWPVTSAMIDKAQGKVLPKRWFPPNINPNKTYWKVFDENDPVRIAFRDKNYYYRPAYACSATAFHKTVIFHNGEKYYMIWTLVNDMWEVTLRVRQDAQVVMSIPMGVGTLETMSDVELACKAKYEAGNYIPFYTFKSLEKC